MNPGKPLAFAPKSRPPTRGDESPEPLFQRHRNHSIKRGRVQERQGSTQSLSSSSRGLDTFAPRRPDSSKRNLILSRSNSPSVSLGAESRCELSPVWGAELTQLVERFVRPSHSTSSSSGHSAVSVGLSPCASAAAVTPSQVGSAFFVTEAQKAEPALGTPKSRPSTSASTGLPRAAFPLNPEFQMMSLTRIQRPGTALLPRPGTAFTRPQLGAGDPTASCYQILEYLFTGGIGVSMNAQLLCKTKIEYLINASGMYPQDLPSEQKSTCPCLCPTPTAHSRVNIDLDLAADTRPEDIVDKFNVVNEIIGKARRSRKKVLIFSYDGHGRAPALVIQYVMWYWRWAYAEARIFLLNSLPDIDFLPNYEAALRDWESRLSLAGSAAAEEKAADLLKPQVRVAWKAPKIKSAMSLDAGRLAARN